MSSSALLSSSPSTCCYPNSPNSTWSSNSHPNSASSPRTRIRTTLSRASTTRWLQTVLNFYENVKHRFHQQPSSLYWSVNLPKWTIEHYSFSHNSSSETLKESASANNSPASRWEPVPVLVLVPEPVLVLAPVPTMLEPMLVLVPEPVLVQCQYK